MKKGGQMKQSRAMVVPEPGRMEMRFFDLPEVSETDGLLKVELVGVCGSDPGIFRGKTSRAPRPYPLILGHEIVGRIAAMGTEAKKRHGVQEGDRVIIEYAFGCGRCRACQAGRYTLCENFYTYGSMVSCAKPPHLYGAYADYLYIHPRAMVHKVGDDMTPEVAVLVGAVLGNAVRWISRIGGIKVGQCAAIVGPGQQGLAAVVAAKESGASPLVIVGRERDRARLDMALRFGADLAINADQEDPADTLSCLTNGRMADVVMDVTGHPSGAETALELAGLGATVVLPGLYGKGVKVPLELDRAVVNELRLLGAYSQDFESVEAAVKIARTGRYPLADMISHRFPLERAEQAVRLVGGECRGDLPLKVLIDPSL
jgi:alcohol dehydrogenase